MKILEVQIYIDNKLHHKDIIKLCDDAETLIIPLYQKLPVKLPIEWEELYKKPCLDNHK